MADNNFILVSSQQMQERFADILLKLGFTKERANECADIFTANSVDGIYTHGVNRFPRFVQYVKDGYVKPQAIPALKNKFGGIEQWDGNLGPGPLNAVHATESVIKLAQKHGIGCVALANTNHWMRGGTYGWQAAKAGVVFIAWTNTIAIMPAWGAVDARLGNNPLVIALPFKEDAVVLDMAMSQFSYGAMELKVLKNENLAVNGGYNTAGELTDDPAAILESKRPLPIGYWKGAGLALLLDLLASVLSGGLSVHEITSKDVELSLSQVFIAIDISKLGNSSLMAKTVEAILADYQQSVAADASKKITYPGERVLQARKNNLANGIPVVTKVWDGILEL
ncbi:MAG: 3-dehydro-L-gulonate 2-dehydrogenase [Ferruginibacter sp.]